MLQVTLQAPVATLQVELELAIFVQSLVGEPQAVSVFASHAFVVELMWKPEAQLETVQAPFGVVEFTVQTPAPLVNDVVQLLQPDGPGPQQVSVLCRHAVLPAFA